MIHDWQQLPHVRQWWSDESQEELYEEYILRTGSDMVKPFVALWEAEPLQDEPLGYIQYYHAARVGDGWWPDETEGTIGMDQYIGPEKFLSRGHGTGMIAAFVDQVLSKLDYTCLMVDPDPENERAIRCYARLGFKEQGLTKTPDGAALLMKRFRESQGTIRKR